MIDKTMILAAGLGTRMRPLTDNRPKPLIEVDDKALIDHKLDAARNAGIKTAVINVHYKADQLEQHLRGCKTPQIIISNERHQLLDSGGGIAKALGNFGNEPFLVMNCDTFWIGEKRSNLKKLFECWNGKDMDLLLGLADINHAIGFDGVGDFFMDEQNLLTRRGNEKSAPFAFAGDYIVHPRIFHEFPSGPFSSNLLFNRGIEKHRLFGLQLDGTWLHVGTPEAIKLAEKAIAQNLRT